jgi:hypothetical protein
MPELNYPPGVYGTEDFFYPPDPPEECERCEIQLDGSGEPCPECGWDWLEDE